MRLIISYIFFHVHSARGSTSKEMLDSLLKSLHAPVYLRMRKVRNVEIE